MKISKEDPRLTAYVLGELSEEDRQLIERAMRDNPELVEVVASLRDLCGVLDEALLHEPLPEENTDGPAGRAGVKGPVRFPVWMQCSALLAPAAAACFVFLVVRQEPDLRKSVQQDGVLIDEAGALESRVSSLTTPLADSEHSGSLGDDRGEGQSFAFNQVADEQVAQVSEELVKMKVAETLPLSSPQVPKKVEAYAGSQLSSGQGNKVEFDAAVSPSVSPVGRSLMVEKESLDYFAAPSRQSKYGPELEGRPVVSEPVPVVLPSVEGESYEHTKESGFANPLVTPLSTFSIDVDTSSYANFRRFVNQGQRPVADAIRVEEWLNYFPYDYTHPESLEETPLAADIELTVAPWQPEHLLARIGIQGYQMAWQDRPASNLVLLLDVSGSMNNANKLPLLKDALRLLLHRLDERDRVAIVVYAGASGLVLPSTTANNQETIEQALNQLKAGGSTNGAAGIELAYEQAQKHFIEGGNNRVILCTDGDFNVGVSKESQLEDLIGEKAASGVYLSVLGFGMGNYQDKRLEILSNRGNGNYAYIDSAKEARKVFMRDLTGTLITIAKDVKLQVEFNPAKVKAYRLIGYENRALAAEDFNNDKKDAGEIGSGHRVTALYEIVPHGVISESAKSADVDALRFQEKGGSAASEDWFHLKIRYKQPDSDVSQLWEVPFAGEPQDLAESSVDTRFAAAVAGAAMILKGSGFVGETRLKDMEAIAFAALGKDEGGYRSEFVELLQRVGAE